METFLAGYTLAVTIETASPFILAGNEKCRGPVSIIKNNIGYCF